ncbi:nitroreductase family deazaflavin-dependent oxidoreductase [Leekyejoonella antrihumi]|uniref:Nitroreductase family deazaflavin-dependent oxidoreductase n=2 Tax=Leekyejoonella antrihumi TaxID=1660198 RepID=A0A563EA55_9MICO|nr:nitroreductase family deazaflavin-dependent oxidoreductase [Leekyejoonella antrihumi]
MPVPRGMGRINKVGPNRVTRHLVPVIPGFGLVVHHGRRSGAEYRTPVNVFRTDTGYVIALAYGPETDWVKNVLAEGGCTLLTRGRSVRCAHPEVYVDRKRHHIRPVEKTVLGLLRVDHFLALQTVWSQDA